MTDNAKTKNKILNDLLKDKKHDIYNYQYLSTAFSTTSEVVNLNISGKLPAEILKSDYCTFRLSPVNSFDCEEVEHVCTYNFKQRFLYKVKTNRSVIYENVFKDKEDIVKIKDKIKSGTAEY